MDIPNYPEIEFLHGSSGYDHAQDSGKESFVVLLIGESVDLGLHILHSSGLNCSLPHTDGLRLSQ